MKDELQSDVLISKLATVLDDHNTGPQLQQSAEILSKNLADVLNDALIHIKDLEQRIITLEGGKNVV